MCFDFLYNFVWNIPHSKKNWKRYDKKNIACPALQYFSTLPHKRDDFFLKNVIQHKTCFEFLYNFVWNIPHSKKNWKRYDKKYGLPSSAVFLHITS